MRLIDIDEIPWNVDGVGEIPVITKEEIEAMLVVDAIPMGYIAKHALAYSDMAQQSQGREFEQASHAEHVLNLLMIAWVKEKYR